MRKKEIRDVCIYYCSTMSRCLLCLHLIQSVCVCLCVGLICHISFVIFCFKLSLITILVEPVVVFFENESTTTSRVSSSQFQEPKKCGRKVQSAFLLFDKNLSIGIGKIELVVFKTSAFGFAFL